MTQKNQRWVPYDSVPAVDMGQGLTRRILAYGEELMCVENRFDAGAVGIVHSHPHTQITYVVCGVFDFCVDGQTHRVRAGDTIFVPGGVPHGCDCRERGAILDIYAPMRGDFLP